MLGDNTLTARDDVQTAVDFDPPYCYFEGGTGGTLKFNSNGGNTGLCNTNDQCICSGDQMPDGPPPPAPPAAPDGSVFAITSGWDFCKYTASPPEFNGTFDCVTDGNGDYGNNAACTIEISKATNLTKVQYEIEDNYDYMTIGGTAYRTAVSLPSFLPAVCRICCKL